MGGNICRCAAQEQIPPPPHLPLAPTACLHFTVWTASLLLCLRNSREMILHLHLFALGGGTIPGMTLENPSIFSLEKSQLPGNTLDIQWVAGKDLSSSRAMFFAISVSYSIVKLCICKHPGPLEIVFSYWCVWLPHKIDSTNIYFLPPLPSQTGYRTRI